MPHQAAEPASLLRAKSQQASLKEIEIPGVGRLKLPSANAEQWMKKLKQLRPGIGGDGARVVNYTHFERVRFANGSFVTGRDFARNRKGEKPFRQFCYVERRGKREADGLDRWLVVGRKSGGKAIAYVSVTKQQAAYFGVSVAQLKKLSRSHCRFVPWQAMSEEERNAE